MRILLYALVTCLVILTIPLTVALAVMYIELTFDIWRELLKWASTRFQKP